MFDYILSWYELQILNKYVINIFDKPGLPNAWKSDLITNFSVFIMNRLENEHGTLSLKMNTVTTKGLFVW